MPFRDPKAPIIDPNTDLASIGPALARDLLSASLAPDVESGILRQSGQACIIVRPDVIVNIQRQLEQTIGSSAKGLMYLSGERSAGAGLNPFATVRSAFKGGFNVERARRIIGASALLGWGHAEITLFDSEAGRFVVMVKNSPLAAAYGPSKKPVCHFLAGWIAGLTQIPLGRELLCEETACASQGRERCEFDLRSVPSK